MPRGDLFDPLFGADGVAAWLDDAAWVRALLDVEAALARAAAAHGVIPAADAVQITESALTLDVDLAELGHAAVTGGNPVIPLVRLLREASGTAGTSVHSGATSQDIMDTALMLLLQRSGVVLLAELRGAAAAAAALARNHRDTPMTARTLGQQALPTTFGAVAASWCSGLDRACSRLAALLGELPVQLGGAAGTLAALHPHGLAVADSLAEELGLARQGVPWHAERTRVAELATALGTAAGACAKPATDVALLAATEVAEVSEAAPGDSSSMPHKQNPIAGITARAAAHRAPGLVSTVLSGMDGEHQRAAGAWHAEWETLTELMRVTAGAAARVRTSLDGLQVHPEAMRTNLTLSAMPQSDNHAGDIVDRVLAARAKESP
ncbi:MAG: 3-carboxy-cis,cis-muconate cycloisomerase [Mycobacteriaceae bacterium]